MRVDISCPLLSRESSTKDSLSEITSNRISGNTSKSSSAGLMTNCITPTPKTQNREKKKAGMFWFTVQQEFPEAPVLPLPISLVGRVCLLTRLIIRLSRLGRRLIPMLVLSVN